MQDTERIFEMSWDERTPIEATSIQFTLREAEVIKLMRKELRLSSFKSWRKRVNSAVSQKHLRIRNPAINRFRSVMKRAISSNKISKR
jgi:uncharacterized protein (TIGR03643 family)